MMAPSPDWIAGILATDMCEDGFWANTKTVTAFPYDAGVDSGASFRSDDAPEPLNKNKIAPITCAGAGGPFCNAGNTGVNPVAEFLIEVSSDFAVIN